MWDALRLDVRHSVRSLRRAPTLLLIVVVTLMVAVGATAALASLVNAVFLRRVAVPHPEHLVALSAFDPRTNLEGYFYADTLKAYRAAQRSFSQMSMYSAGGLSRVEARSGVFDNAVTGVVSPSYFDLVGARPSAGRFFNESDDAVILISEDYRRRLFGNASGVGETITVDGVPATVIGVGKDRLDGLEADDGFDLVVPFALTRAARNDLSRPLRSYTVVGRLAPGVSIDAAPAELLTTWPSIHEALLRQRLNVARRFREKHVPVSEMRPHFRPTRAAIRVPAG